MGDVVEVISGGTPKTNIEENWDGGIPWISIKDFEGIERKIFKTEKTISKLGLKNSPANILSEGNIVISARGTVGEVVQLGCDMTFNQSCYGLKGKEIINDYLFYLLKYNRPLLLGMATGATFGTIIKKTFDYIMIQIPDLPTQEKIAQILSTYDELIENNNRRIEILEKAAEEIYKEWFVRMRFPGYEKTRFHKGIPEGWEVKKVGELAELVHGYTASADTTPIGPKYLRGTDVNKRGFIDWDEVPYCEIEEGLIDRYRLYKDDIVIIRMADPGKVAIIEENREAVFASYLIKIKYDKEQVKPYYMFYALYSEGYQEHIKSFANGTTRNSINSKMIMSSKILLPNLKTQEIFQKKINSIREQMKKLISINQNLSTQRDLLLPRLMNGSIRVK